MSLRHRWGSRATIDLLERGRGAGPASPSPARAAPPSAPRTSGPGCWPSPQPSCCSAPRSPRNWPPSPGPSGWPRGLAGRRRGADGRQTITTRARAPRRQDAVGQLPTGEVDLIVRGLAERVRIIRTRVPASVETVARSLTAPPAAGTWHPSTPGRAVASREVPGPSSRVNRPLRVLRLGVDPPGRSQVRQYRPPAADEEHPPVDRERPGPLRP
jgi:hypothetical protein